MAFSELYSPRIGRVRKIQPSFFVAASLAAQGTGNRGTMMLQKVQYYWANAEERRIYVQRLHIEGEKLPEFWCSACVIFRISKRCAFNTTGLGDPSNDTGSKFT